MPFPVLLFETAVAAVAVGGDSWLGAEDDGESGLAADDVVAAGAGATETTAATAVVGDGAGAAGHGRLAQRPMRSRAPAGTAQSPIA